MHDDDLANVNTPSRCKHAAVATVVCCQTHSPDGGLRVANSGVHGSMCRGCLPDLLPATRSRPWRPASCCAITRRQREHASWQEPWLGLSRGEYDRLHHQRWQWDPGRNCDGRSGAYPVPTCFVGGLGPSPSTGQVRLRPGDGSSRSTTRMISPPLQSPRQPRLRCGRLQTTPVGSFWFAVTVQQGSTVACEDGWLAMQRRWKLCTRARKSKEQSGRATAVVGFSTCGVN